MEKTKEMTKKEMFERLISIVESADVADADVLVEKLKHEVELVSKKRSGQTKTQKENEELVKVVFDMIANAGKAVSITELYGMVEDARITSAQKLSALVKKLKDAEKVERIQEGKNVKFVIASAE